MKKFRISRHGTTLKLINQAQKEIHLLLPSAKIKMDNYNSIIKYYFNTIYILLHNSQILTITRTAFSIEFTGIYS